MFKIRNTKGKQKETCALKRVTLLQYKITITEQRTEHEAKTTLP